MNTTTPPLRPVSPSQWRLVNLAFGLSAGLKFASENSLFPAIAPLRWLPGNVILHMDLAMVAPLISLVTRSGINLCLPASLLMVLFWLLGVHRKAGGARYNWPWLVLAIAWAAQPAMTLLPLVFSNTEGYTIVQRLILRLAYSGKLWFIYRAIILAIVVAAAVEFTTMFRFGESKRTRFPVTLLSMAVIPPLLFLALLLIPLARSDKASTEFAALCKDVGVKLVDKPAGPVRSIAYDWNQQQMETFPQMEHIVVDENGRIRNRGEHPRHNSPEEKKALDFEFTEWRTLANPSSPVAMKPIPPFIHIPASRFHERYHGVDALTADVLAYLEIDNPVDFPKTSGRRVVRYKLTLTDRRSGKVIGVHTYVEDQVNLHACGTNGENVISRDAFIYDAINQ